MKNKTLDLVYCGMAAVLLTVCSWISIPAVIPFTLQTFAVFLTVLLLGGRRGTIAIAVYLLLGALGIPVFANFGAGIGYLLGATGGYAVGFLLIPLIMWLAERLNRQSVLLRIASMLAGLFACYAFGTLWYLYVYTGSGSSITPGAALSLCVVPFIIPDLCKMALSLFLAGRLKKLLPLS